MEIKDKQVLTTGDVAKYCGVHFRTVTRWIHKGHLKAFHLPGRDDSRIFAQDFLQFLKSHGIEVPKELNETGSIVNALIVEDDPIMARTIKRALVSLGIECEIASDGFRAGVLLGSMAPKLITLDLNMPGLGGLKVLEMVRTIESAKDSFVLIISGMEEAHLKKAVSKGANAYLKKPFTKTELEQAVKDLVQK
jgi:excisionase family DNA binding protein